MCGRAGIRTVRAFATEWRERERYAKATGAAYSKGRTRAIVGGIFAGLVSLVGQYAVALLLWLGGKFVLEGEVPFTRRARVHFTPRPLSLTVTFRSQMTAPDLTSFLLYTLSVGGSLGGVAGLSAMVATALGSSEKIFELLQKRPSIPLDGGEEPTPRGTIRFLGVSFSYPSRPDILVLRDVSFSVFDGTVVALCGPSGSGKSSVLSLIERFYDPTQGRIEVGGVPLTRLDPSQWRRRLALVSQEPLLFGISIRDNILYGRPSSTEEEMLHASRAASAHDFISSFPDSYDTMVGERGIQLSCGQKQRVCIARAIVVSPLLLLLDEATSALDAESEHIVQAALDRLVESLTTIVVAHRLSTVRRSDCIHVLRHGCIVESGSHESLLSFGGLYHQLASFSTVTPSLSNP